jgi:cytochrome P450
MLRERENGKDFLFFVFLFFFLQKKILCKKKKQMLLALFTIAVASALVALWHYCGVEPTPKGLEGPPPRLLFGNLLDVDIAQFFRSLSSLRERYGDVYRLRLGLRRGHGNVAVVTDPDMIQELTVRRFKQTERGDTFKVIEPFFGNLSFFLTDGESWHMRRKFFSQAFSQRALSAQVPRMVATIERLEKLCIDAASSRPKEPVDMKQMTFRLALDLGCSLSFNYDLDALRGDGRFDETFDHIWVHLSERLALGFEWWRYIKTPNVRRFDEGMALLEEAMATIVRERRAVVDAADADADDVDAMDPLTLMLRANKRGIDVPFSDKEIRDDVFTFLNGSVDTTAGLFAFMVYLLAITPRVAAAVRRELVDVLGQEDGSFRAPTFDDLSSLRYCDQVVRETLRLYPPAAFITRGLTEDFEYNGVVIPQSYEVIISIFGVHRSPTHWPEPDRFDPGRFSAERSADRHPMAFLPFSSGRRNCQGWPTAMMEGKLFLAILCRHIDFELLPDQTVAVDKSTILHVRDPLMIYMNRAKRT